MIRLSTLAAAGLALFATAPSRAADLGTSLAGETCTSQVRDDLAAQPGLPPELKIACNGKAIGSLSYDRLAAELPTEGAARRTALAQALEASRTGRLLRERMTCRPAQWLEADGVLVLPCRMKSGGWPAVIVATPDRGILSVAEGPPAIYAPLRAALGRPVAANTGRQALVDRLQSIWGEPVVLASVADIDRLKSLLRDARVANGLGKYAEAESLFRQALDIHSRLFSTNDTTAAEIMMDLALNVSNQRRADEAAALFRRAEPILQRSANAADRAKLATYLGYEAAGRGDYEAALRHARAAAAQWQPLAADGNGGKLVGGAAAVTAQARGELAMALNLQGLMALRTGDVVSAYAAASEALLLVNATPGLPRWWKADVLVTLGEISVAQGRLSAAETYLNNALELRQKIFGEGQATLRVRTALGRAYQSEGMNSSAIIAYREAFRQARLLPGGASFTKEELIPFGQAVVDYAAALSDVKERQGLYAEAFDAFQMAGSPLIDRTIAQASARMSTANPEIAALLRQIEDTERSVDFARVRLAHEQSLSDGERSAEVEDKLQTEIAAGQRRVAEQRRDLKQRFPSYASLDSARPLQLDAFRARLGEREGVLSFLVGRDRSFVQLVRRDGVHVGAVPLGESALRDAVADLRRSLEIQAGTINEFDLKRAHGLYRDIFAGIEPQLGGLNRLVVVPGGPLASLPFALLVTETPRDGDYVRAAWLVKRAAIAHTPSLAAFYALRSTRPAARPARPLLAFGDPVLAAPRRQGQPAGLSLLAGGCRQDGPMPSELLRSLASLPDTAAELRTVARALGAPANDVFLGSQANEAALRSRNLSDYRVLYLATHGLLPGELKCQSEPGLVLTPPASAASRAEDGLLEASEVAQLSLNADLVVLSACNTAAGGGQFGGEALSGLSEAFFHAGARNMLVSHWQVPSGPTAELMSGLFTSLGPDMAGGAAQALRSSQLRLAAQPRTAHPFFWAAFVVMGDGAEAEPAAPVQTAEVVK